MGFALGSVTFGILADRLEKRRILFLGTGLCGVATAIGLLFSGINPTWLTVSLMGLLGFFTGGQSLAFVMAADTAARHTRGMKLAFVNFVVMILPVAVQPGVGFISSFGNAPGTTPSSPQELMGFGLVVALMMLGAAFLLFTRETHPREGEEGGMPGH